METALANIGQAFAEGFDLILTPSILTILPIILAVCLIGNKKLPWGVAVGFMLVFALFTFFNRSIVEITGLDLDIYRALAFAWLMITGIILLSNFLSQKFKQLARALTGASDSPSAAQAGFGTGFLIGALTAIIWTPYNGPVVAEAIVQTVLQTLNITSFLILLAFAYGAILLIMVIVILLRSFITVSPASNNLVRKIVGCIVLVTTIIVAFNYHYSAITFTVDKSGSSIYQTRLIDALKKPYPAPAIEGIKAWINSAPLTASQLKGKVIMVNFSSYSCLNCIRALPYFIDWYNKYHDNGLLVIDIHSPEFDFEKSVTNTRNAAVKYDIPYPIALDTQRTTWKNFNNEYWPSQYLIDTDGNVVYQHVGEGDYATTENNIRFLLGLNKIDGTTAVSTTTSPLFHHTSAEIYTGYSSAKGYAGNEPLSVETIDNYTMPSELSENAWALKGKWTITNEDIITSSTNAAIKIHFYAKKVWVVMGTDNNQAIPVHILYNGEELTGNRGVDVKEDGTVLVDNHGLYEILDLDKPVSGELELLSPREGLEIYTIAFG